MPSFKQLVGWSKKKLRKTIRKASKRRDAATIARANITLLLKAEHRG
jgi:hypothetical protein